MLLAWREIATITLTKEWQYTELTGASFFRITHTLDGQPLGTVRGAIGQSVEGIVFDRRLIGYRPGFQEGQLFIKPDEVEDRPLALQRLDDINVTWNLKVEELINLATSLPLSIDDIDNLRDLLNGKALTQHQHQISDVNGLAIALDEKVEATDLAASEQLILAQVAQKSPIGHVHTIADVTGLSELEVEKSIIISETPPLNPYLGLQWYETNSQGLIDLWQWDGSVWVSAEKTFSSNQAGTGSAQSFLPLSPNYNYRWLRWRFWLRSGRVHLSNEYALPSLRTFEGNTEVVVFTAPEPFAMPANGNAQIYEYILVNKNTITTNTENRALAIGFYRVNAVNYAVGSELVYQLVRK
ncbi:MAG: hypothetical protein HC903_08265 [Methylacidiphilales bacterium]|nr:hypothetical protein [Candidatus Methylacidiphilales bacterium]